jgi:hypothetical protein
VRRASHDWADGAAPQTALVLSFIHNILTETLLWDGSSPLDPCACGTTCLELGRPNGGGARWHPAELEMGDVEEGGGHLRRRRRSGVAGNSVARRQAASAIGG